MVVYRTEYYEDKIEKWVPIYETKSDIEKAKRYLLTPIIGKPPVRVAKYEKTGVRKIKYKYIETIDEK